jgi:hypothetical protein
MLSRRLFFACTVSAALPSLPALAAPDPDPSNIVKSIYGKRDLYGAQASLQLRGPRGRILSRSLAALWKRSDDETPAEDEPVGSCANIAIHSASCAGLTRASMMR